MKAFKSLWFQAILSLALIAGIWQMRQRMPSVDTTGFPEAAEVVPVSDPQRPTTPIQPRHDWAQVESDDYRAYVGNLRASGFPEDLVREIVIADLDALYAPLEDPLKFQMPAPDAPRSERNMTFSEEDWARLFRLRELRIEKQQALKEILGIYVPRELLRGPRSRNYEAYEYALGLLPQEKRDAAQLIIEQEIIADALNHQYYQGAEEVEAYRRSRLVGPQEVVSPEWVVEISCFERASWIDSRACFLSYRFGTESRIIAACQGLIGIARGLDGRIDKIVLERQAKGKQHRLRVGAAESASACFRVRKSSHGAP
jgi:hypothetical protein